MLGGAGVFPSSQELSPGLPEGPCMLAHRPADDADALCCTQLGTPLAAARGLTISFSSASGAVTARQVTRSSFTCGQAAAGGQHAVAQAVGEGRGGQAGGLVGARPPAGPD